MKQLRRFNENFSYERYLLTIEEVLECIDTAVAEGTSYSLARFGHAEIAELQVFPDLYWGMEYYRKYNGVTRGNLKIELMEAFKSCTTAGILPTLEDASGAEYSRQTFLSLGLEFYTICSAWATHHMVRLPYFWDWVRPYRLVLVGRRAAEAAPIFASKGVAVVDAVMLSDYEQLEQVYQQLCRVGGWNIALIAAGVPATLLAPRLANATGKVAIDFGHAIDLIIDGEDFDFEGLVKKLR
ncbi:GT-D fold domain-containing glycosyltransferase [Paenibacillus alginolyticus]|uniref:GT-D fold domain-containing protein n=1 Tax=Paenibacillus alginolyticus TaxID=59839 RepID=UPI0003F5653A|nr:GT-D fold domain-containing glycosyltransferase [Paenibacillus alginolyticus]MCY9668265.1 GT-D fold domain-containing glycosyltransferase [Paenibacillus alginolyticus]